MVTGKWGEVPPLNYLAYDFRVRFPQAKSKIYKSSKTISLQGFLKVTPPPTDHFVNFFSNLRTMITEHTRFFIRIDKTASS